MSIPAAQGPFQWHDAVTAFTACLYVAAGIGLLMWASAPASLKQQTCRMILFAVYVSTGIAILAGLPR